MPMDPEQALDESTFRKVEGAFDDIRIAARNVSEKAREIEASGGEERLVRLMDEVSADLATLLKQTMSKAYFRPPTAEEQAALDQWKAEMGVPRPFGSSRASDPELDEDQVSLFGEESDEDEGKAGGLAA